MIKKERLEELIEQGATIYEAKYGKVNQVSLKNKIRFVSKKYPVIVFEPRPNEKYKHHKYFDKLYETQAEAEWVVKMHTERTEKFEPPTWEEIKNNGIYRFIDKQGWKCKIECYYNNDTNRGFIDVVQAGTGMIGDMTYSEENYIKAVEYARKLFKGEE